MFYFFMAKRTVKNNSCGSSHTLFIGCLFLGIGLGVLLGHAGAGTLIGLGVGFLATAYFKGKQ